MHSPTAIMLRGATLATLATTLFQPCFAAVQPYSNTAGVALALESTTNGSAHDLRFQLSVPTTGAWGGVGIGDGMAGALFFVLYPNSARTGATVSVRTASGEVMPRQVSGINYDVTNSSISNGKLVANIICYSCTWQTLDFTSASSAWMWAVGPSGSIASNGGDQTIQQHASRGHFNVNLAASITTPTTSGGSSDSSGNTGSATGNNAAATTVPSINAATSGVAVEQVADSDGSLYEMLVKAHAILLSIAFFVVIPLAVILLHFVSARVHYALTTLATVMAIAGMAIAIRMSLLDRRGFMTAHQIIGLLVVSLLPIQALGGAIHHWLFKKHMKHTPIGFIHVWSGRIALLLGLINVSLGLNLAKPSANARAGGVGAAAAVVYLGTIAVALWQRRRHRLRTETEKNPRHGSE